jgi:hypothetical protein
MLANDDEFATFVGAANATWVAEPLRALMDQADGDWPIETAAAKFAEDVVAWAKRMEGALDLPALMATVHLAGLILFRATEGRRRLQAGVALYQLLADAASRASWLYRRRTPPNKSTDASKVAGCICYLASEIYQLGGHTRLIEDFVRLAPGYRHVVLVTSCGRPLAESALRPGTDCELYVLEETDRLAKLQSGLRILEEIAPDAVLGLGHPFDPLVGLLIEFYRPRRKVHVHHADHSFSLVPAAKDFPVAVLFRGAAEALRTAGVRRIVHLPVTCTDPRSSMAAGAAVALPPLDNSPFTTATSGSPNKFDPRSDADYLDLLAVRYSAKHGRHLHFGPLRPEMVEQIEALQLKLGRTGDFVQIPFVPYLSVALAAVRPDLYVGSYPMGGKRASVEAMAAGCPIAAWQQEGYHSAAEIVYPEHLRWDDLDELAGILVNFTQEKREWHSQRSRECFERNHSEAMLRDHLFSLLAPWTTCPTSVAGLRARFSSFLPWTAT